MKRVLILEPYFGGSHRSFLLGLQKYVPAEYHFITLPARKWKLRMQLSAPWYIEQIEALPESERYFDTVICSSFIDVAVFRALVDKVNGWNKLIKTLVYFHENQFVYPYRSHQPDRHQFSSINFHSALASDAIAFNSKFNMSSFFAGCQKILFAAKDMALQGLISTLTEKSRVLYPGIDFSEIDELKWRDDTDIPVILWNHRWEHDKNPEQFFSALEQLKQKKISFRLLVLGQSFHTIPACFELGFKNFRSEIIHFGFVPSYEEYISLLGSADIVVSTSLHEFFGISVIEAVRAGCIPLVPDRLSYPELFNGTNLYSDDSLVDKLAELLEKRQRNTRETAITMTERFSWQTLKSSYEQWL